jgi:hypothetical protein
MFNTNNLGNVPAQQPEPELTTGERYALDARSIAGPVLTFLPYWGTGALIGYYVGKAYDYPKTGGILGAIGGAGLVLMAISRVRY